MNNIINAHHLDRSNPGDYFSGPHHYFDKLYNSSLHILELRHDHRDWVNYLSQSHLIIGGGGLLNCEPFEPHIKLMESLPNKSVLWGLGHNNRNPKQYNVNSYNVDLSNFGLVGTRDYGMTPNWVPCVSCLHPFFDLTRHITQEIGVVLHKKTAKNKRVRNKFNDLPIISNGAKLEKLLDFIGSSDTIITDSYHAMYWGILMEKKVVTIPMSSKFFNFKYDPVFSTYDTAIEDTKKTIRYSGVLEECREINNNFANQVFEYLEI